MTQHVKYRFLQAFPVHLFRMRIIVWFEVIILKHTLTCAVIGGDFRQVVLASLLAKKGYTVTLFACERQPLPAGVQTCTQLEDCLAVADCILLPMPLTRDQIHVYTPLLNTSLRLDTLFAAIPAHATVIAGAVTPSVRRLAQSHAFSLFDLLDYEQLAIANAIPTAEGALQIAMEELPITLHGAQVLVLGYGRIGRVLAHHLQSWQAQVTVAVRSSIDRALLRSAGLPALHSHNLVGELAPFSCILNTVPAPLLGEAELATAQPDCLLIDLASDAGGMDKAAAAKQGLRLIHALSLPGKVAPISAAVAILDTVHTILHEEGFL